MDLQTRQEMLNQGETCHAEVKVTATVIDEESFPKLTENFQTL